MATLPIKVSTSGVNQVDTLNRKLKQSESITTGVTKSLTNFTLGLGSAYLGMQTLSSGYDLVIDRGLKYNATLESQTLGLASLVFATDNYINSLDDVISAQDRYALASEQALEVVTELEKVNANTPQSLEQTIQIYKTLLPSMQNVGATTEELITLTEKLGIASSAVGIEFNSLLAGVDGLASGTVLANSDLGRFLSAIGLTNEALKESTDVVALLNETLNFKPLDDYATATSNLNVQWDKLTGTLTKDIFGFQKESIKEITAVIEQMNRGLNLFLVESADVSELDSIDDLTTKIKLLQKENQEFFDDQGKFWTDYTKDVKDNNKEIQKAVDKIKELKQAQQVPVNFPASGTQSTGSIFANVVPDVSRLTAYGKSIAEENAKAWEEETDKFLDDWNKENADFIKSLNKSYIDFGSIMSNAIIAGIQGSGLKDFLQSASAGAGTQLLSSGFGALALTGAINPYTAIGAGIGLTALSTSGLFGGGDSYQDTIAAQQQRVSEIATDSLKDFTEALDKSTQTLEAYGSVGSATNNQFNQLIGQISTTENDLAQLNSILSNARSAFAGQDASASILQSGGSFGVVGNARDIINLGSQAITEYSNNLASLTDQFNSLIETILSSSLDYTRLTTEELTSLTSGFDSEAYENTLDAINKIALAVKQQGGDITEAQKDKLLELYSLPNFILGQDYSGALDELEERNEEYADSLKSVGDSLQDIINDIKGINDEASALQFDAVYQQAQSAYLTGDTDSLSDYVSNLSSVANVAISDFNSQSEYLIEQSRRLSLIENLQDLVTTGSGTLVASNNDLATATAAQSNITATVDTSNTDNALTNLADRLENIEDILLRVTNGDRLRTELTA